ncbi:hypothetical protein EGW08_022046 [Elysia chlorotica]|uniref:Uncharacterized protein n=1 Tax=Elysia chlorotica TaxID=188477 RepID=A0A3S0ZLK6_ELYCH|nr:hypothetical protein EGW08_022046 [Elysia chlorotica]
MTWLPVAVTLLCACAQYVIGIMPGGFHAMSMGGFGGLGGYAGYGAGLGGFAPTFEDEDERVLTCSNRELDSNNRILFAVAVTVREQPKRRLPPMTRFAFTRTEDSSDLNLRTPYSFGHGMGYGMGFGMGMGMGLGMGMSPGFGFGMGPFLATSFDDDDDDDDDDNGDDEDAGVMARIPMTRGSVSTLMIPTWNLNLERKFAHFAQQSNS